MNSLTGLYHLSGAAQRDFPHLRIQPLLRIHCRVIHGLGRENNEYELLGLFSSTSCSGECVCLNPILGGL